MFQQTCLRPCILRQLWQHAQSSFSCRVDQINMQPVQCMARAPLGRKRSSSVRMCPVFYLLLPVRRLLSMTKTLLYTDYQPISHTHIQCTCTREVGVVSSSVFVRLQAWTDSKAELLDYELRLHISCVEGFRGSVGKMLENTGMDDGR